MNKHMQQVFFWIPRVLSILFALVLSLFALDVFGGLVLSLFALDVFGKGYSFGTTMLALLIHLTPTLLVVISLVIAWQWELGGAILFVTVALLYLVLSSGGSWVISGPMFLVGILFMFNWKYSAQQRACL